MAWVIVTNDVDQSVVMAELLSPGDLDREDTAVPFLERLAAAIEESRGGSVGSLLQNKPIRLMGND